MVKGWWWSYLSNWSLHLFVCLLLDTADDGPNTQVAVSICSTTTGAPISSRKWLKWLLYIIHLNQSNIKPCDAFFTQAKKCRLCCAPGSEGIKQQADFANGTFIAKWRRESKEADSKRCTLTKTICNSPTSSWWCPKIATMIVTMWYFQSVQLRPYQGHKLWWSNKVTQLGPQVTLIQELWWFKVTRVLFYFHTAPFCLSVIEELFLVITVLLSINIRKTVIHSNSCSDSNARCPFQASHKAANWYSINCS